MGSCPGLSPEKGGIGYTSFTCSSPVIVQSDMAESKLVMLFTLPCLVNYEKLHNSTYIFHTSDGKRGGEDSRNQDLTLSTIYI